MRWICALLFLLMVVGCTDKVINPEVDQSWKYPLQVGNEWNYDRNYYAIHVDTQDTVLICLDFVEVRITHIDNITTQVVTNVMHSRLFEEDDTFDTYDWYAHQNLGLFSYAYIAGGALITPSPPQSESNQSIYCKGIRFNHPREITRYFMNPPRTHQTSEDSAHLEIPPVKCLPYPLVIDYEWDYRSIDNPFHIGKKITDQELVETPAGNFDCWVIEWKWDLDNDGQWDEGISGMEYVSNIGLIKRWYRSDYIDQNGEQSIWDDTYVMRSYIVQ